MSTNRQAVPLTGEILGLGPEPCEVLCPSCQKTATTLVEKEATTCTHYSATCCWCWFTCCGKLKCCEFCDEWQTAGDLNHYCSQCGCFLGRYHQPKETSFSG